MSTIQILERTGPKLPAITNKNLAVLPWDWELPSTILKSEWAAKHNQCALAMHDPTRNSYCGQGILLHYYGWEGGMGNSGNIAYKQLFGPSVDTGNPYACIRASFPFHKILELNDNKRMNFYHIGLSISNHGV